MTARRRGRESPRWLLGVCAMAWCRTADAANDEDVDTATSRHAIELSLHTGMARMLAPAPNRLQEVSRSNGGITFSVAATYRSPYIVSPFVEFGYTPLYENDVRGVRTGASDPTGNLTRSTLSTWSGVLGVGLDEPDTRQRP